LGCVCDGGFTGADCSQKICKAGPDPLYYDDYANIRYSNYTVQFYTKSSSAIYGNYSLVFYDSFGEDWQTMPISINADCETIRKTLEAIPNDVIPDGSVRCYMAASSGSLYFADKEITSLAAMNLTVRYTVAFPMNYGRLDQIDVNIYLDGTRPTLYTDEVLSTTVGSSTLGWHIYPNGFIGENEDLVPDLCEGVLVTITDGTTYDTLAAQNTDQTKALKRCLGDADGSSTSNVEVYNWDYGSTTTPHLIKLIEATQDNSGLTEDQERDSSLFAYPITKLCDSTNAYLSEMTGSISTASAGYCSNINPPGFFAVIYFDGTQFKILTRAGNDYSSTTTFHVYTTQGTLQAVNKANSLVFTHTDLMDASTQVTHAHSKTLYLINATSTYSGLGYRGQVDCETAAKGMYGSAECIDKEDYVMIINNEMTTATYAANPVYPNIYKVKKIFRKEKSYAGDFSNPDSEVQRHQIILDYGLNARYDYMDATGVTFDHQTAATLYKFIPSSSYNYVGECSNRGVCDNTNGLCTCFAGFTGDNCGMINALAV